MNLDFQHFISSLGTTFLPISPWPKNLQLIRGVLWNLISKSIWILIGTAIEIHIDSIVMCELIFLLESINFYRSGSTFQNLIRPMFLNRALRDVNLHKAKANRRNPVNNNSSTLLLSNWPEPMKADRSISTVIRTYIVPRIIFRGVSLSV